MNLIDWWRAFQRRVNRNQLAATLAASGEPAKPKPDYVSLPVGTDYKKLAIALIEQCGYVVITGDRKRGGQPGSRKKPHTSMVPPRPKEVVLPAGAALRRHVEILKEENPKLNNKAALRRILELSIGDALKRQGASDHKIKTAIDKELPGLETRYYESFKPRKRLKPSRR
jgi:hypothetical protein